MTSPVSQQVSTHFAQCKMTAGQGTFCQGILIYIWMQKCLSKGYWKTVDLSISFNTMSRQLHLCPCKFYVNFMLMFTSCFAHCFDNTITGTDITHPPQKRPTSSASSPFKKKAKIITEPLVNNPLIDLFISKKIFIASELTEYHQLRRYIIALVM